MGVKLATWGMPGLAPLAQHWRDPGEDDRPVHAAVSLGPRSSSSSSAALNPSLLSCNPSVITCLPHGELGPRMS